MQPISDETIMAYVDGELDQEEAEQIARALETDPELRDRARLFRESTAMLREAYSRPLEEEVPERLLRTVRGRMTRSWTDRLGEFLASLLPRKQPAFAAALGCVLILGLGLILYFSSFPPAGMDRASRLAGSNAFSRALETLPSGRRLLLQEFHSELIVLRTFQDRELRFCRQFEMIHDPGPGETISGGIACRNQGDGWSLVFFHEPARIDTGNSGSAGFELAGSGDPVDAEAEAMRTGPPLTPEQEAQLIATGWEMTP